jgi:hypothetical protein
LIRAELAYKTDDSNPPWEKLTQERLLQAMAEKQEENAKKSFQTLSLDTSWIILVP